MAFLNKEYSDNWAYDIHKNVLTKGEIRDEDVISQSVEMIIATYFGERLFNIGFGSPAHQQLFENLSISNGEQFLDNVIGSVKKWEDRISVIDSHAKLQILRNQNAIILSIPYIIKKRGKYSIWKKKIYV